MNGLRTIFVSVVLLTLVATVTRAQWSDHQNASVALGVPDFVSYGQFLPSDSSLTRVRGLACDLTTGKVFVADRDNNRVLRFSAAAALLNGSGAEAVFGQADGNSIGSGTGYNELSEPEALAIDRYGNLYVADAGNARVLRFANALTASTGATADAAFDDAGQPMGLAVDTTGRLWVADFSGHKVYRYDAAYAKDDGDPADGYLGTGSVGPTQSTTGGPSGLAADTSGRLWVSCGSLSENRVLRFDNAASKSDGGSADGLLGHSSYTSGTGGTSQTEMFMPWGLAVRGNDLYVADRGNNRVLRFTNAHNKGLGGGADNVYGQANFTSDATGLTSSTFNDPQGLAFNSGGTLFVADFNNYRVLRFASIASKSDGDPADGVFGQSDFTSNLSYRANSSSYGQVYYGTFDPATGKLFVSDYNAHRIVRYSSAAMLTTGGQAEAVLGQTDFGGVYEGTTASKFSSPYGMTVDGSGRLWVADASNNRVLRFDNAATCPSGTAASQVLGQQDFVSSGSGTTAATMYLPAAVTINSSGDLFVADLVNNRILVFLSAASKGDGADADMVLGQSDFTSSTGGTSQSKLSGPGALAADGDGRLWVADGSNNRILRFDDVLSKSNGGNADGVLGQSDFTSSGSSTASNTMSNPIGVAIDTLGALYVADNGNSRVLVFLNAAAKADGGSADFVLGQADFVSSEGATTQNGLNYPSDVTVDAANGRLWVVDGNNRVLRFSATGPLPVQMGAVSAEQGAGGVVLRWNTVTEVDNAGWMVERKAIADFGLTISDWEVLGFVEGKGTSTHPQTYTYVDNPHSAFRTPQLKAWSYRLKQLDRSGSSSYSQEIRVDLSDLAPRVFQLSQNYPNPFNPTSTLSYTLGADGPVTLKVYDVVGREVATLVNERQTAGVLHEVTFDASGLSSGTYVVRLVSGGKQMLQKVMLLK